MDEDIKTTEAVEETAEDAGEKKEDVKSAEEASEKIETSAPKLTKYEQELERKKQLKNDKRYKSNKKMYDLGMILLAVIMIINSVRYFMQIEIFINGAICTQYLMMFYIIPCFMMMAGLIGSKKVAKEYEIDEGFIGIAFVGALTALLTILAVINIITPSYHIYKTEDVEIKNGEKMTVVEYVNVPAFKKPNEKMPLEHSVDVFRNYGIFAKRLATADVFFAGCHIEESKVGKGYCLVIKTPVSTEKIPFNY